MLMAGRLWSNWSFDRHGEVAADICPGGYEHQDLHCTEAHQVLEPALLVPVPACLCISAVHPHCTTNLLVGNIFGMR